MHPYLTKNETEIDAGIVQAKANIITFLQNRLIAVWQTVLDCATQVSSNAAANAQASGNGQPNPVDMAKGLWSAFGPSLMGALQGPAGLAHERPVLSAAQSSSSINSVDTSASDD